MENIKKHLAKYALIALMIILLMNTVKSFLAPYLSFLVNLPVVGGIMLEFIALMIIIIPTDLILNKLLEL